MYDIGMRLWIKFFSVLAVAVGFGVLLDALPRLYVQSLIEHNIITENPATSASRLRRDFYRDFWDEYERPAPTTTQSPS